MSKSQKVPSEAVETSVNDLTDVSDDHSLTSVDNFLRKYGFGLKRDNLANCLRRLGDSFDCFQGFDVRKKAVLCSEMFLFSDLNSCGSGILPELNSNATLPGPYILQVNEIRNVRCLPQNMYQHAPPEISQRCLKLSMTDGIQTVVGIEWKPIKALKVHAPRGLKVAISTVKLRDGCLLLAPENIRVLGGGLVEQLDEAQNEPSRGKRNGELPLVTQATRAAQPSSRVDDPSHSGSTLHSTDTVQASNQGKSDDLITEGCKETSGLVVCFGEMLCFLPLVGEVSLDEASAFKKAPGGAPANVAVGISKLGGSSAFISKVGEDDIGYMLADILKQNNVDTSGMRFDRNARTALAFVTLTADGEHKFLFLRNPSADMLLDKSKLFLLFQNPTADMLLDESEVDHNLIKKAKIFHFGSISLIDEPCKSAHLAALEIAKASDCILSYDPNLRLSLWPSAKAARDGIMSIWDEANVIKISKDEITFLTDGDNPYDDVVINKLFHSKLKLLIVTEGSEGCRYYTKDFKGKVRGVNVQPVDTTGAGDAFVSGILYHIASDPSIFEDEVRLREALYFANVCGAITVRERDAIPALPTKDAVLQFDATLEHKLL